MSLYGKFIKEREGKEIVEDHRGFATYSFLDADRVYIENIYIAEDYRQTGVASEFYDQIASIAKAKGCTKLLGSVCPLTAGATTSVKILLACNFELDSSINNLIFFIKSLGDK